MNKVNFGVVWCGSVAPSLPPSLVKNIVKFLPNISGGSALVQLRPAGVDHVDTDYKNIFLFPGFPPSKSWTCHLCDHFSRNLRTIFHPRHQPPANAW